MLIVIIKITMPHPQMMDKELWIVSKKQKIFLLIIHVSDRFTFSSSRRFLLFIYLLLALYMSQNMGPSQSTSSEIPYSDGESLPNVYSHMNIKTVENNSPFHCHLF